MGARISATAEKPEYVNLSAEQLRRTELELKRRTKAEYLDYDQFLEIYSALQPAVPKIYTALQHKGRCSLLSILQLADNLLGDAASEATFLLKVFGTITNVSFLVQFIIPFS